MVVRLGEDFFSRDAEIVARELLGKVLVRSVDGKLFKARIVETEAYYDEKDPASRACKNGDLKKVMQAGGGKILVYGVHNNWLINFISGEKGKAEAVLLRALEPLNFKARCSGPGLLTKAMRINKLFHKEDILNNEKIWLEYRDNENFEIIEANRIGVRKDLKKKLRFYIKDNKCVSKK